MTIVLKMLPERVTVKTTGLLPASAPESSVAAIETVDEPSLSAIEPLATVGAPRA